MPVQFCQKHTASLADEAGRLNKIEESIMCVAWRQKEKHQFACMLDN